MDKRVIFVFIVIASVILLSLIAIKYSGFVVQTPSSVSIYYNISVNYTLFDGSTTDFSALNDTQLEDIANLTLEKSNYGKIVFSESINLAEDAEGGIINMNDYVTISSNLISIDTDSLAGLSSKPAILTIYGLNFNNPRILRNGAVCPDSICQITGYSGGILTFSVSQFSSYSAEETPSAPASDSSGTTGGGGGITLNNQFNVDKDLIKLVMKQGETQREIVVIKNIGNRNLDFNISLKKIDKFAAISEDNFILSPNESKEVYLDFFSKEEEIPDSYTGNLTSPVNSK